jgi:twinkle protein
MKRSVAEISDHLSNRAEEVAMMLLPGGHRLNGSWVSGDINGGEGKSLQVHVEGQHAGKWKDWADSEEYRGDLIDLWRLSRGLSPKETLTQIKSFLGIFESVVPAAQKSYSSPKENGKPNPQGVIYQYLMGERNLEAKTIQEFDVRGSKKGDDVFLVFPSFGPDGELKNNSYRSLVPDKDGKKVVRQDTGCAPSLFGWQAMKEEDYRKRSILICEGQIDAMTWRQWGVPALSIPNGGGCTWIEYEWENLEMFETIYLSFDMDGKTRDSMQKAISRLGKHRCMVVNLPHKDANDCLKAGITTWDALDFISNAKAPAIKDFISGLDLKSRVVKEFWPDPLTKKTVKVDLLVGRTTERTFFIRAGEVTLWTGIAGHGKSTFLKDIFMNLLGKGEKVMITSLEMKPEKVVKTMLKSAFGQEMMPPGRIEELMDGIGDSIFFCDKIGYTEPNALLEMMEFAHCRYGVTQFMIDSLMRIEGLEEDYPAQGKFMNRLSEFSKTYDCHVHLVTHPRKTEGDVAPTSNDLKGSSLLRNNADNIIVVVRNFPKERKEAEGELDGDELAWDAKVTVEKDREEGYVKVFKYQYAKPFNRFKLIQDK